MRTKLANPLQSLLRECYRRPHPFCLRTYASNVTDTSSEQQPQSVAVIGGGITGLTAAYLLSQKLPAARITLYEASHRLGGWMQSSQVDVEGGRVIFEQGPRTLRPGGASGMATLDLIRRLGLENEVLVTSKNSAAARNRYIYYPDHLVRMPGPGQTIWEILQRFLQEPIFRGVAPGIFRELFVPPRPRELQDESIGSFLSRRYGAPLPDNLVSAVLHGIYAGDIDQLSVKSLFPALWFLESESGSVVRGLVSNMIQKRIYIQRKELNFLRSINNDWYNETGMLHTGLERFTGIMGASVYTFRGGLEQLSTTLIEELEAASNVTIKTDTAVVSARGFKDPEMILLEFDKTGPVKKNADNKSSYRNVVSTLAQAPFTQTQGHKESSPLYSFRAPPGVKPATPMSTVMVVNLHFTSNSLLPVRGFGYLLPRSLPLDQNPERALGVVFDSDATQGQDTAPGTKLTVMMGGHWWSDWPSYPDEQEGLKMACAILKRHLGIRDEPDAWQVTLQKDCIPQYHVGHAQRMMAAGKDLEGAFGGKLRVAGAGFHGVSVNDCVRSGYEAADKIVNGERGTGLEALGQEWVLTGPRR